jgi:hypothetical protein
MWSPSRAGWPAAVPSVSGVPGGRSGRKRSGARAVSCACTPRRSWSAVSSCASGLSWWYVPGVRSVCAGSTCWTPWRGRPRVTVSAGPGVRTCCVSWLRTQYRDLREPCLTLRQCYDLMECAWCRRRLGWKRKQAAVPGETSQRICSRCAAAVVRAIARPTAPPLVPAAP